MGRGLGAASLVGMGDEAVSADARSAAPVRETRSRVDFLLAELEKSTALQMRMVDWRSAAAWAALAGALALVSSLAIRTPILWFGVLVIVGATVVFLVWRRRAIAVAGEALINQAEAPEPDVDWDRTGLDKLPAYFLEPSEMTSPAQLEAALRLSPEDLKDQASRIRGALPAALAFLALAVAGLVLLFLGTVRLADNPAPSALALESVPLVLAGIVLLLGYSESVALTRIARRVSGILLARARPELDRLWQTTEPFMGGKVLVHTDSGYLINESAMTLPPTAPRHTKILRAVLIVLVCVVIALMVFVAVIGTLRDSA